MRTDKSFNVLVSEIKLSYLKMGKTPPSSAKITKVIAKKLKEEDIIDYEKFIRF